MDTSSKSSTFSTYLSYRFSSNKKSHSNFARICPWRLSKTDLNCRNADWAADLDLEEQYCSCAALALFHESLRWELILTLSLHSVWSCVWLLFRSSCLEWCLISSIFPLFALILHFPYLISFLPISTHLYPLSLFVLWLKHFFYYFAHPISLPTFSGCSLWFEKWLICSFRILIQRSLWMDEASRPSLASYLSLLIAAVAFEIQMVVLQQCLRRSSAIQMVWRQFFES